MNQVWSEALRGEGPQAQVSCQIHCQCAQKDVAVVLLDLVSNKLRKATYLRIQCHVCVLWWLRGIVNPIPHWGIWVIILLTYDGVSSFNPVSLPPCIFEILKLVVGVEHCTSVTGRMVSRMHSLTWLSTYPLQSYRLLTNRSWYNISSMFSWPTGGKHELQVQNECGLGIVSWEFGLWNPWQVWQLPDSVWHERRTMSRLWESGHSMQVMVRCIHKDPQCVGSPSRCLTAGLPLSTHPQTSHTGTTPLSCPQWLHWWHSESLILEGKNKKIKCWVPSGWHILWYQPYGELKLQQECVPQWQ